LFARYIYNKTKCLFKQGILHGKDDKKITAKKQKVVQKDILLFVVFCIIIVRRHKGVTFVPIKTYIAEETI